MVSKIIVFGVVGGIALMCGLMATILYANATFDEALQESINQTGSVEFKEKMASLPSEFRSGSNRATITVTQDINVQNIKEVVFSLSWTDDEPYVSGADELTMEIFAPSGAKVDYVPAPDATDASGQITITVKVNDSPDAGGASANNGAGEWKILVSVNSSQLLPGVTEITTDFGNDWTLNTEYVYFEPVN